MTPSAKELRQLAADVIAAEVCDLVEARRLYGAAGVVVLTIAARLLRAGRWTHEASALPLPARTRPPASGPPLGEWPPLQFPACGPTMFSETQVRRWAREEAAAVIRNQPGVPR